MGKFCGFCGENIENAVNFCPNCGRMLATKKQLPIENKTQKQHIKEPKKKVVSKKILVLMICSLVLVGGVLGVVIGLSQRKQMPLENNSCHSLLGEGFTDISITDSAAAIQAAQEAGKRLLMGNAMNELSVVHTSTVGDLTYYRLQQSYKGVPVDGCTAVVVADNAGYAKSFSSNVIPINEDIDVSAALDDNKLKQLAAEHYNVTQDKLQIVHKEKILFGNESPELCQQVCVSKDNGHYGEIIVSVKNEKIISEVSNMNPSSIECTCNGIVFPGSKDCNGQYVLANNNFYCLTAEGKMIYDQNGNAIKDTAKPISSNQPEFDQTYQDMFVIYENVKRISDYYSNAPKPARFALVDDAKGGLMGGLLQPWFFKGQEAGKQTQDNDLNEKIGVIALGNDHGEIKYSELVHEYTHIITNYQVGEWKKGLNYANESQAINEAYSDLFGIILDYYKSGAKECSWNYRTDLKNPRKDNYYTMVNQGVLGYFKVEDYGTVCYVKNTGPEGRNGHPQAYTYVNAVALNHAAYLMSKDYDSKNGLSIEQIETLWYHTLLILPHNCTYQHFRQSMELTANTLNYSEAQLQCIADAFTKIGIYDKQTTWFSVRVLDKDGNRISKYSLSVEGYEIQYAKKKTYSRQYEAISAEDALLKLPKGEYVITVSDGEFSCSKSVTVNKDSRNTLLEFWLKPTETEESQTPTHIEKPNQHKPVSGGQNTTTAPATSPTNLEDALIGEWAETNFMANYYAFYKDGSCRMLFSDSEPGTFELDANKCLKIVMPYLTKKLEWNSNCSVDSVGWYYINDKLIIEGKTLERFNVSSGLNYDTPYDSAEGSSNASSNGATNGSADSSIVAAYKKALTNHPKYVTLQNGAHSLKVDTLYTLYDIDKNGVPELIVNKNQKDFTIYTFKDGQCIKCGEMYSSYANCLYEYGDNGILVHDGGFGYTRIEFIYLYCLSDEKINNNGSIMDTTTQSYDEIKAALSSYTPIDNWYVITDDTLLNTLK